MSKCRQSHALQLYQISIRYRYKQTFYGRRKRTYLFKLYQGFGIKSLSEVKYAWQ